MGQRRCRCGAPDTKWVFYTQRSGTERRVYYRCTECSLEWTEVQNVTDLDKTVTVEEVIDVHAALANPNLTVEDLVHAT